MKKEHIQISRSIGTVSFYTFLSRLLGLARDIAIAWVFGATRAADVYYVAFRIPNMLRRLVAEGALTISFVPVFTECLKKSREEARDAFSVVFTYLLIFLILLVIAGILGAPLWVKMMAWGFSDLPEKFDLTVYLTRLMFPYILLISLTALAMGALNSLKHFAAPAASPIFLNIGIIFGAAVLAKFTSIPITGLALGVLVGGLMQLVLQIPFLARETMLPRINFNWRHPAFKKLLFLMGPSAFGAAVYQLNLLVVTLFASFLKEGSVSYLSYADRINEFPLGIFSIAIATVTLPTLARSVSDNDFDTYRETINRSLRLSFFIAIPSAIGLHLLSYEIVEALLQRGKFTVETAQATAKTLAVFSYQIPFVSAVRNIVPGFFSLKDSKTPVYASAVAVIVNFVAALLLVQHFSYLGLAAAMVIASAANFFILSHMLSKKVHNIGVKKIIVSAARTLVASLIMAAVLLVMRNITAHFTADNILLKVAILLSHVIVSAFVFMFTVKFINKDEYQSFMAMLPFRKHAQA